MRRALDTDDDFRMDEPAEKEKRKMWHFGEEANIDSLSSWAKNEKDQPGTIQKYNPQLIPCCNPDHPKKEQLPLPLHNNQEISLTSAE